MSDQKEINLPDELKDKPVPFQFFINIADALESRIDYNFNSMIQVSLLVEYMYSQLEEKGIEIKLDEKFEEFQNSRLEEITQQFEKIKKNMKDPEEVAEEIFKQNINMEDS